MRAQPKSKSAAAGQESALLARWREHGDEHAREVLVRMHMPTVRRLASRYSRTSSQPYDDLVQVASLGLIKAIDRFDPQRGESLRCFAVPTILGEMRRYFRDCGWAVHVPRGAQERALKVRDAQRHLTAQLGAEPTVARIAEFLELDIDAVVDALSVLRSYESASLDAAVATGDGESATFIDLLGEEDANYELVELATFAATAMRVLPARERLIMRLRFGDDLTQAQIAQRVGLSQMQVSRLLRRSLDLMRLTASVPS